MKKRATARHIALDGEFTIFNAAVLRDRLLGAFDGAREIDVDLSQVTEIDSAGVQLMIAAKREAAARAVALRFSGHSPAVVEVLDLYELPAYFGDPVLIPSQKGSQP